MIESLLNILDDQGMEEQADQLREIQKKGWKLTVGVNHCDLHWDPADVYSPQEERDAISLDDGEHGMDFEVATNIQMFVHASEK